MKKFIVLGLTLTVILQASLAFSAWTLTKISPDIAEGLVVNKIVWAGKIFFFTGENNGKGALGEYDLSSNQFEDLSYLLPTSYESLNDCVWTGKTLFAVGTGRKKGVLGKYTPSTKHFEDLTNKIPNYWKYNLGIAFNGKTLAVVGESANGLAVMGTYDPSTGKFADLSNETDIYGFLESVSSNGKGFFAVGLKSTMPQRSILISYDPLLGKLTNLSTVTYKSDSYDLGLSGVSWNGEEYIFDGGYAVGSYAQDFKDLSKILNDVHLLSFPSNMKNMYGELNGVNCSKGHCILFGNGILLVYNPQDKVAKGVEKFISNYEFDSLTSAAWDGKEFLIVGNEGGKTVLFTLKP